MAAAAGIYLKLSLLEFDGNAFRGFKEGYLEVRAYLPRLHGEFDSAFLKRGDRLFQVLCPDAEVYQPRRRAFPGLVDEYGHALQVQFGAILTGGDARGSEHLLIEPRCFHRVG